ncbi:ribosomal protein S18-alanine N-acetyltransferase [Actinotalea sp. M2MS4P-6]|uniref:ribosomal protein S18-alanine N-acetyltransferase n=1 Tax=Actinotalea sp. M2MS4P-6 TaxID=2983762 RepID=UPI0021E3C662|nr:ribosomal protein S18-alanine N-acetyltransferase [Actinotalea sp. M2MS4P-6]MCV2395516.1 ribosomal protein S18-alanine N-acetyltransferase [Actinotalea sp. M2MS4P-6]
MTGLRSLVEADVPTVAALERELFARSAWTEPMIRDELTAPGRYYVAMTDDEDAVLAYAGSWFDGDVSQVMTLGVASRAQRHGLGRILLRALLDHARGLGASAMFLEVAVDNDAALALYTAEGFEILARRPRYYQPEDVDAWTMRLML